MSAEAPNVEPNLPEELTGDYHRTFNRLRSHFRVRGVSPEEAADLAQEAALRAYLHVRRSGVTADTLFPLLNQIARNLLIDRHRRSGPQMLPLGETESAVGAVPDPAERSVEYEAHRAVREAVEALPERHRNALLLALAGMTPVEVGARMGIGSNAARVLLHRARRSLRDRLRGVGESALGLAVMAYLRLLKGRKALREPAVAGAAQTIGAAAAALAIAFNIGGFAQPAIALNIEGQAQPAIARVLGDVGGTTLVAAGPQADGGALTRTAATVAKGSSSTGSATKGFLEYGSTGRGGLSNEGSTNAAVTDGNRGDTIVGVSITGYYDPSQCGATQCPFRTVSTWLQWSYEQLKDPSVKS